MSTRRLAGSGVLMLAALLIAAGIHRGLGQASARRSHTPPFVLPHLLALDAVTQTTGSLTGGGPSPRVIIYASESCAHCHAELRRWARLAAGDPALFAGVEITVASRDVPSTGADALVPAELPHRRVYDHDRTIAAALNVVAVPTIAYVDRRGVVRALTVGERSDAATRAALRTLTN